MRLAAFGVLFGAVMAGGCLPSYRFDSSDASDAGAGDGSGVADGPSGDAPSANDAAMSADTIGVADTGPADTAAGVDAPPTEAGSGVALDPGFPVTSEIDDAEGTTVSTTLDVPAGGRMLVAVVVWGQHGGSGVWPVTFASAHLTWTSAVQTVSMTSYTNAVGVGVWTAWASGALSAEIATATCTSNQQADALVAVYSLSGASMTLGATGTSNGFTSDEAPLSFTVDAQAAGSFVVGGILDGNGDPGLRGNTLSTTTYDMSLGSASGDGLGIGRLKGLTTAAGNVTIGQDASFAFDVAAGVEIRAAQ